VDLFDRPRLGQGAVRSPPDGAPLAERMRPRTLAELVGQAAILGEGAFLELAIARDQVPSLVLWGPPGSGKTSLAQVIAEATRRHFAPLSAVLGGLKEVRAVIDEARHRRGLSGRGTILFLDEIHRFHRGQQDALLPHVEDGSLTLIGATTENPSFSLCAALLSRCRVVGLEALAKEALVAILERALRDPDRGLGHLALAAEPAALELLAAHADGDARRALNALEQAADHATPRGEALTEAVVARSLASPALRHDRAGDAHYRVVSAFIKSLRGSDPDAGLYYLARMLEAGEDPRFVTRRLLIFASEDVGNADPRALEVAVAAAVAFDRVGLPEGRLILAQAVTYLATAPKSDASTNGIERALDAVRETGTLPVPTHLIQASSGLGRELGWGAGYQNPHHHGGWVDASYLPEALAGRRFYEPTEHGYERHLRERLAATRKRGPSGSGPSGSGME
jgi:putative ATPase